MAEDSRTRTLDLDGRAVTYDEAGAGPGLPLLMVHGFTGGREDFGSVLGGLAQDRRVVAVDLPGHGGSEGPDDEGAYGLGALAGWVLRVATALGLDELHLLGHSLGGLLAQRAAAASSQRLRSLVLAGTGLGALREEAAARVVRIAVAARDEGPEAAVAATFDDQQPAPDERARALERFRRLLPAAVVGGARNLIGAEPLGAFLRGIDVPVLVLHGDADEHWTAAEQRLLAATVAGAQRVVVPDAGHNPHLERPDAWLALVRGFLERAENRVTGP